ncbi:2444_t:CDS:2 [Dentiscutata erythropus]|uniref:2444_t:CDS:1 n=1 Tax=Dentiscutata erythropus TaxID=1348616 RepID=A0A9N9CV57_9GLOM|nr:2444_t:CDS:2 [Dentiscutata erythropus]
MGWSPGKGLGINEDGSQECIKLSHKQDNLGVGASKKTIDNWLDNSNAFNDLLKGLNQQTQDDSKISNEPNSNTDNSDCTSIRLAHRAKYLKSKKAAVQDSERLKEILGIKTKSNAAKMESISDFENGYKINQDDFENVVNDQNNSNKNEKDCCSDTNGFQTIVNKLSTQDYFSLKAKQMNKSDEQPCFNMDNLSLTKEGSVDLEFATERNKERKTKVNLSCDLAHNNFESLEGREKRKGKECTKCTTLNPSGALRPLLSMPTSFISDLLSAGT